MLLLAILLQSTSPSAPADTLPSDTTDVSGHPAATVSISADVDASAYLDAEARELVRRARVRLATVDRSITEYRVIARERISAGLRAMRRDRILYRRELAADITWRRDGVGRVEVLGAREVVPVAVPTPDVRDGVGGDAISLAFDPGRTLVSGLGDGDAIRNPISPGSEADYRFASGDTTRIRLASGRVIRLAELRIIPRRSHGLLLQGSLWLDLDTHAAVRGSFRLASPLDVVRDVVEPGGDDDDDVPGILQPMIVDLRYLTIDYGLWEDRWWMPRLVSLEGEARIARLARVPVRFERSYDGYRVTGDAQAALLPSSGLAADEDRESRREGGALEAPTAGEGADSSEEGTSRRCRRGRCWRYTVEKPADSVLLASAHLSGSIYDEGTLISETELRDLASVLDLGVPGQTGWRRPVLQTEYLKPHLARYNRVEGLALGARASADLGTMHVEAEGWLGSADLEPKGELRARRQGFRAEHRLAAYRRLNAVQPSERTLDAGSSLAAFLLGRDDDDYFAALGVEVTGRSLGLGAAGYEWRIFAERQSAAEKNTDVSLPWVLRRDRVFHENIAADAADQVGAEVAIEFTRGGDPRALRWGIGGTLLAEAGGFRLARPTAVAFMGFPLPGPAVAAFEIAGGTAFGQVPVQRLWYLGGPETVRGYGGGARISGDSFWRTRAELASAFPGARLALFSDAGWAGPRDEIVADPPLLSVGVGASLLDGLVRVDLSRALRAPTGLRLDLYLDGVL